MDSVIYSTTPLWAFSGSFFVMVFMLILGGGAGLGAIFNKRGKVFERVAMGCSSVILILAFVGMVISTIWTIQGGDKTATVKVNNKQEVISNCDDADGKCKSYLVETQAGQKFYDFHVVKDAYERIEVGACYAFTYYPPKPLLGKYLQQEDYSDVYESGGTITRIEKAGC